MMKPPAQGNRISKLSQQVCEEGVVPSCAFDFSSVRDFGFFGVENVEGHVAQDGEIVGSVVEAVSGLILVHGDVQHPMEAVLDGPMGARDLPETFGGHRRAEKVIPAAE